MRNVIFTADDYGMIAQIDAGVRKAVRARKINSVAILANPKPGQEFYDAWRSSIADLLVAGEAARKDDETYRLEVGIHLTLTSGYAVNGPSPLCEVGSTTFRNVKKFDFSVRRGVILAEINAQYDALDHVLQSIQEGQRFETKYSISHISSHHNILVMGRELFQALLGLEKRVRKPIRSVFVYPYVQARLYRRWFVISNNLDNNRSRVIRKIKSYRDGVYVDYDAVRSRVCSPDLVDMTHYGPVPGWTLTLPHTRGKAQRKKRDLLRALGTKQRWAYNREFLFHLIDDVKGTWNGFVTAKWVHDYPGVDHRYFDSRFVEFRSLMSLTSKDLYDANVQMARWWDL
jgi:predicted glycoside hydrolase/deacetylase ChbG (UPF0249 family)